ncbi:hypothetical protein DKX38_005166 [Salix brachista]|uniref:Uncharacterized protein n=1 Tax=Salix brachista TaxID=2182728 RepID=A0A5N5ND32_9ROSI|nr:hypothetical protein DKX38_005166 [Salix brachista]
MKRTKLICNLCTPAKEHVCNYTERWMAVLFLDMLINDFPARRFERQRCLEKAAYMMVGANGSHSHALRVSELFGKLSIPMVRLKMKEPGGPGRKKNPGYSWNEIDRRIQPFFVEDRSHPTAKKVSQSWKRTSNCQQQRICKASKRFSDWNMKHIHKSSMEKP